MKSYVRYFLVVFGILILTAGIAAFFDASLQSSQKIALSEVVTKINAGEVKEMSIEGNNIMLTSTKDERFSSKKESAVSAFETLLSLGADKTKLGNIKTDIKEPSGVDSFFASLIPILLPF